ncbi:MAG: MFS transporter, partial [Mycetocola sp.]
VAQNVAGIRVQARVGRSVLSSMHALWSLGGVVGAATGTAAAAAGLDPRLHLAAVAVACVALVGTGARLIGAAAAADATVPDPATAEAATAPRTRSRVGGLLKLALPLVIVAICGVMVEDVANNWAAMSATQIGGIPVGSAGIAFTIVLAAQCLGRFSGDLLIQRFGRAAVSRSGGVFIAAGGALIVCASGPVLLCVGLALAGWGCATLVPSAMAAAAELPGVSEGAGVTLVSWLMRIGFLITSPLIGSVTDAVSLRAGLGLLVVVGLTVVLLSGSLRQKVRPAAEF